jgi:hypothetical protein
MPMLEQDAASQRQWGRLLNGSDYFILRTLNYAERRDHISNWGWLDTEYDSSGRALHALNVPDDDTPLEDFAHGLPRSLIACYRSRPNTHATGNFLRDCVDSRRNELGRFYDRIRAAVVSGELLTYLRRANVGNTYPAFEVEDPHAEPPEPPVLRCLHCTCLCEQAGGCDCRYEECYDCGCIEVQCDDCSSYCAECTCGYETCASCGSYSGRCSECDCTCYDCYCGDGGYCERCGHGRQPRRLIYGYSERPLKHLTFQVGAKEQVQNVKTFFGVELEVNIESQWREAEYAEQVVDLLGEEFVILKYDGSIDNGFEIVTAPATLAAHRERWLPFFENKPKGLTSWNSGQCGMHVHVSRPTAYVVGKMLVFLNEPSHQSEIVRIAGRNSTRWAALMDKKLKDGKTYNPNRYEALNTTNSGTVEVRIFRGTVNPQRFMRNLEFVVAMTGFCKEASFDFNAGGKPRKAEGLWDQFVGYVADTRYEYPVLHKYLQGALDLRRNRKVWVMTSDARLARFAEKKKGQLVCV